MKHDHWVDKIAQHTHELDGQWQEMYRTIPIAATPETLTVLCDGEPQLPVVDDLVFLTGKKVAGLAHHGPLLFDFYLDFSLSRHRDDTLTQHVDCPDHFQACSKDWYQLQATRREDIRFCQLCRREVIWCHDQEQVVAARQFGMCVAFVSRRKDEGQEVYDYYLGGDI